MSPEPVPIRTRELVAREEVGRTTISRAAARALIAIFLLTILAVPLAQHVYVAAEYAAGRRASPVPYAYAIFDAVPQAVAEAREEGGSPAECIGAGNRSMVRFIRNYRAVLEEGSAAVGAIRPYAQFVLTGWLGAGTEDAYVGRDGWLFYRPTLDYLVGRPFLDPGQLARRAERAAPDGSYPQPDPRPAILEFHRQLSARGIRLMLVPAPSKPMICPEHFWPGFGRISEPIHNQSFAAFKAEMEREGIPVFDAAPALLEAKRFRSQFLVADTHWRPDTVEEVAGRLARFIDDGGFLPRRRAVQYRREADEVTNLGDVARMIRLPDAAQIFPPETVRIEQVLTPQGGLWRPDRAADVLVLGDSYSNIYSLEAMGWGESAGLVEQLSFALRRPIDAILRNGAGAYAARELLSRELARGHDRLAGKRLVIWEFAVRELVDGDWQLMDMSVGRPPPQRFVVPPTGSQITVTGRIHSVSHVPRPGKVQYRNHIMSIHLEDLRSAEESLANGQALVYTWSMRDQTWTPAARFRPGQEVTLRLRPWRDVADEYEGINRSEIEDDDDGQVTLQEPCWGDVVQP
jgi:alginate O-acetyltransferase complex protein AlgJ